MTTRHLLFLLLGFNALTTSAQNHWQVLPDTGLTRGFYSRYEDVYFTDSTTGFAVSLGGYIFKTKDAGRRWKPKNLGQAGAFRSIEFLDDKKTGLAGCLDASPSQLYRTDDGGETWFDIDTAVKAARPGTITQICGMAHWGNTFYGVGAWMSKVATLYKSTDKGLTWTLSSFDTALISGAVDICFTSADTGFVTGGYRAGTGNQSEKSVVLKTTDGGLSWKQVFSDISIGGRIWKIQALSPQLLVGSIEPYYKDTVAMVRSTDGGNNWTIIGTGYRRTKAVNTWGTQGIGFVNSQHGWLGGYYNGFFETKDGGLNWDTLSFGANFNRFFVLDSNHVFAGGADVYFYGNQVPVPVGIYTPLLITPPHHLYPALPNPARGIVRIEFDLLASTNVLLQVASVDARQSWVVADGPMHKGHYVYSWDGRSAPSGNYIIWLGTNEIPVIQRFVLQH